MFEDPYMLLLFIGIPLGTVLGWSLYALCVIDNQNNNYDISNRNIEVSYRV